MDQFEAARVGNVDVLRGLLKTANVNDVDGYGRTVLHIAAWRGHVDCVKMCIELHANVNARISGGLTPLHSASRVAHLDVVRVLLDAGATVDATDNTGWTPLYWAIRDDRPNIAKLLIDRGALVSNVKIDDYVKSIPDWINTFIASRSTCRNVAIIVIGISNTVAPTLLATTISMSSNTSPNTFGQ